MTACAISAHGNGRLRGFTLLEVLIGMSLLSIMMILLFASLRICIQNWDAGEKKITQINRLAVMQKFLSVHLQAIRPLQDGFSYDKPVFSFQGKKNQLRFVSSMPASAGRMGLQYFVIGLKPGRNGGKDINVAINPFFPLMTGKEWKNEEIVILEKVKKMRFSYYGAKRKGQQETWRRQWLEMNKLPLLVSVIIEMQDGELWPEIVVAPKNDINNLVNRIDRSGRGLRTR